MPQHNLRRPLLGLDIGHHQARAVVADAPGNAQILRLDGQREPVVLRWTDGDRPLRVIETVRSQLAQGEPGAGEILRDLAAFLAERVQADGVDPSSTRIRIGLPTGQSQAEADLVAAAFAAVGFELAVHPVVPRTVSALAAYAAHAGTLRTPLVVIDNDAGVVSTASAEFRAPRLGPARLLSGPDGSIDVVAQRLQACLGPEPPHEGVSWLCTGSGANRPEITRLCQYVAPWPTVADPLVADPAWVPVSGLLESRWLELLIPEPVDDVEPQLSRQA